MTSTEHQQQARDSFIAEQRRIWGDQWETIEGLDRHFLPAYLDFAMVPWRKNHLDAKTKELVAIAIDAAATHMYLPGVRHHVAAALRRGATGAEIFEVLELAATLGIHAMNIGVPLLVEVLEERGLRSTPVPLNAHQQKLKDDFTATRGYWHPFWDEIIELDPDIFEAYTEFSSIPWRHGILEPKVKEFVYIAFDCAATHLYVKGLKIHFENALDHGATIGELLEVMEIASAIGVHAVTTAVPILRDELDLSAATDGQA
jgi:alkylhydroperoxidase/carboxymuconolactone decarboxylase family protein YurZ